jgi:hypothetical protein
VWSVLFGFPASAAKEACAAFKCMQMRRSDFLCMLVYACGLVPTIGRVALLLARGGSTSQLLSACFRVLFLVTQSAANASVWAAGVWPQQLGFLQGWRTVILVGAISFMLCIPGAAVVAGGTWRAAGFAAVSGYHSLPRLMLAYRHVVEPVTINAGMLPALILLAECVLMMDAVFGRPQLLGLRPVPAVMFMAAVHLGVEYRMQRRLARHVATRCKIS